MAEVMVAVGVVEVIGSGRGGGSRDGDLGHGHVVHGGGSDSGSSGDGSDNNYEYVDDATGILASVCIHGELPMTSSEFRTF